MPFDLDRPTDDEHVNVTRALHDVNVAGHVHDATDDDERADVDPLASDHAALLIEHEQLGAKHDHLAKLVDEYLDARAAAKHADEQYNLRRLGVLDVSIASERCSRAFRALRALRAARDR